MLLLSLACGAAATTAPDATSDSPASPDTGSSSVAPTAVPRATSVPVIASSDVNPGKVTYMVGSFANERMTYCLAGGGGHDYGRQIHAFLIESGVEAGARVLKPGIATDWSVSTDGKTWSITIRDGVKFHDGSELTVDDVVSTLKWATGPEAKEYSTGGGCISQSQLVQSVEKTSPNEVSISYGDVYTQFESYFSSSTGVWIGTVYPAGFGQDISVIHDEAAEEAFDRNPIGAGIFQLADHKASESMTFERFDDHYWQPANGFDEDRRPRFQTFELVLVPEPSTRVAALRAGEADIAPVSLSAKAQIESGGGRLMYAQEGAYFGLKLMGSWVEGHPFNDIKVRQALNYAINREAIRDRLYGGSKVMVLKGWMEVTPSSLGYTPELDPFPYDPVKARELLAEAGYAGGEGFIDPVIILTWPSTGVPNMPEAAQLVGEMWRAELGINPEVRVSEEADVKKLTRLSDGGLGQVLFRDNETELDPSDMLQTDYGAAPTRSDYSTRDPEINAMSLAASRIIDPAQRWPAVSGAYKRFRDESFEQSFGYINIPFGVGPRIQTWEPYPLAFYPTALHTISLK
ncbi:MAG: ABC transporter substrate-binding protein [Chloroflexi bacterium]|nr:ABC transporter substrate-binding protein [Chloroflexota bacterium]